MQTEPLTDLKAIVEADPSSPRFVDYARELLKLGESQEAMLVCLRGLSGDPGSAQGRIALAEAFFIQGLVPFAVREVEELSRMAPENETVSKLLAKLDPGRSHKADPVSAAMGVAAPQTTQSGQTTEVAEEDFSIDDLESL